MKISVIIPIYNQKQEYFKEAIESVINQTVKPYEIIIVDDGSEPAQDVMLADTKGIEIKYIRNKKNMGIGFSRQRGVEEATGNYIAFLSSDDVWDEKFLETMLKVAEENPNKILYSNCYFIDENSKIRGRTTDVPDFNYEDFCIACLDNAYHNTMFVNFSTTFFPKKVFEKVQFDKKLRFGEDLDFLLRSMKHFKYYFVRDFLLKYRVGDNLTSRIKDKIAKNNEKIIQRVREYWEDLNNSLT